MTDKPEQIATDPTPETEETAGPKVRILVVEDHAPTRMTMGRLIEQAGAEVVTARDGDEGMNALLARRFDVLLTDLRMPGMDGFELLEQASKLPDTRRPGRMIAISGEYEAGALGGRAVQFLPKPFNLESLLQMISGKPN